MNTRDLLRELVSIPSPTGKEADAVAFLQDRAREDGLRVRTDAAGNFVAEAGRGQRLVLWVGHVDTVPGHIPVRLDGDTLWGRGAVDAKGCAVAAYEAARRHLDDGELRILLYGCVDEEGDSKGAAVIPRNLRPEAMVVGEPSGADALTLGYKGILRGTLHWSKPVQHGGHPGHGAVESFIDFWSRVRSEFSFADGFNTFQGRLDRMNTTSDGIHDAVHAKMQVRLPPGAAPRGVEGRLHALASEHGGSFSATEALAAAVASNRTPLVAAFRDAQRKAGFTPRLLHKTGTADFNHLAEWFPGVPIAAYGPGDSSLDHTPEERIDLRELDAAVEVLDGVFTRLAAAPRATLTTARPA